MALSWRVGRPSRLFPEESAIAMPSGDPACWRGGSGLYEMACVARRKRGKKPALRKEVVARRSGWSAGDQPRRVRLAASRRRALALAYGSRLNEAAPAKQGEQATAGRQED